jgi:hypothetical protein
VLAGSLFALGAAVASSQANAQGVMGGGFLGLYQSGTQGVTAPAFHRLDPRLDFTWTGVGPGGSLSPGFDTASWASFSGSWTGQIVPATSETYTFTIFADDSVALYFRAIGATSWTALYLDYAVGGARTGQASMALTAGTAYEIAVHYWQHDASGRLRLSWSTPTRADAVIEPATPIGINADAALPNDPGQIFADAVKQSSAFLAAGSTTAAAPVDGSGWPTADATLPLWSNGIALDGSYRLSFAGTAQVTDLAGLGTFSAGGTSYGTVLPVGTGYDAATNTTTATWQVAAASAPTNASLGFTETQRTSSAAAGSGFTDLQIMRPIAEGSATSHQAGTLYNVQYEALLANFTAIRFMDYLATNGNRQAAWSDRVTPQQARQYQAVSGYGWEGKGGSLEYLAALANETGRDVWIDIPLYADADYVTKLAQLLAYGSDGVNSYTSAQSNPAYPPLNSNLKIYLEYSNEIWNTGFQQNAGNTTLASAEVAAGASPLNYDGSTDGTVWARRRIVEQTVEISTIFRSVFGDAAMMTRIRPVFEWDYGNTNNTAAIGLTFLENYYDNADGQSHVTAPEPATYFLWGGGAGWYVMPESQGASSIDAIYASGETTPSTEGDAVWALAFGLHEMGYEGGFEIGGDGANTLQVSANLAPQAQAAETTALDDFFRLGGEMPFVFNAVGNTAYGMANPTVSAQSTPKLAAIVTALDAPPPATGFAWPLPIDAGNIPVSFSLGVTPSGTATGTLANVGDYIGWSLDVTAPTDFTITTDATPASAVQILIDDVVVGTGSWTGPLSAGLHGLRVRNLSAGGIALTKAIVTKAP